MRPPRDDIYIPGFPREVEWLNVPFLAAGPLLGSGVPLVWFWDYCSLNSLRALPYLQEWHERYADAGLRVIGVHSPQFPFGRERPLVEAAVDRLGIEFAVAPDPRFDIWRLYGAEVWPSLYLWDRRGVLRYYHFGEGEYEQTELALQELLEEIDATIALPKPLPPLRDTDEPGAVVRAPTPHRYLEDDRSPRMLAAGDQLAVRYRGAAAAAVLDGEGEVEVDLDGRPARTIELQGPRLYELVESPEGEQHELKLRFRGPARAYAFSFAPGMAE